MNCIIVNTENIFYVLLFLTDKLMPYGQAPHVSGNHVQILKKVKCLLLWDHFNNFR